MKKMINGKIVNTANLDFIARRTAARSWSNDPIADESIMHDAETDKYYLYLDGYGRDLYTPSDDITLVGDFIALKALAGEDEWSRNMDLLDHIEEEMK
jgi:hypothetical protein